VVYLPEYVVGHWWEQVLHNQSALRLKARLLFQPGVMVTSVPWQLRSSRPRTAPVSPAPITTPSVNPVDDRAPVSQTGDIPGLGSGAHHGSGADRT
jgi:hypothetical protein